MAMCEFPNPKGGAEKKIRQFEVRGWITNAEDPFWMPKRRETSPTAAGIRKSRCGPAATCREVVDRARHEPHVESAGGGPIHSGVEWIGILGR